MSISTRTAGIGLALGLGVTALSGAPALAVGSGFEMAPTQISPFASCAEAAAAGAVNIPRGDPNYSPNLDRDGDGVACEEDVPPVPPTTQPTTPPTAPPTSPPGDMNQPDRQIDQRPHGGAGTGIATNHNDGNGSSTAASLGAAGLLLVAATAGSLALRRRRTREQ